MRKLTEQELKLVQKSIIAKEVNILELLTEIYDHYITHLESFPEEDFSIEFRNLESIWTYDHCQKIQKEFYKNINSSIRSFQWKLTKSYFTWPKLMITVLLFFTASLGAFLTPTNVYLFGVILPILLFLLIYAIGMSIRCNRKFQVLKSIFNFKSMGLIVISGETSYLLHNSIFPINLINLFILSPKNLGFIDDFSSPWMTLVILLFSFFLFLHTLTIHEAWKIKSKTALL